MDFLRPACAMSGDSDLEDDYGSEFNVSMSAKDLHIWLKRNGIPEKFCGVFEGKRKL